MYFKAVLHPWKWCLAFLPLCRFAPWLIRPMALSPIGFLSPCLVHPGSECTRGRISQGQTNQGRKNQGRKKRGEQARGRKGKEAKKP